MKEKKIRDYSKEGSTVLEKPARPVKLRFSHKNKFNRPLFYYRCSCGTEFVTSEAQVKSGKTSSCGCFARKVRAHNIQTSNLKRHIKEIENLGEVKKRKYLKEKYSKQYTKILLELSNK